MVDDKCKPPVYLKIDSIISKFNGIPIILSIPFSDFKTKLRDKSLNTNILYDVNDVPNINTANRLMGEVRKYRKGKGCLLMNNIG